MVTDDLNLDLMTQLAASALVPVLTQAAEIGRDEIRRLIRVQDEPSLPGEPPASRGRYVNAWRASKARVYDNAVVAYIFNEARFSDDSSMVEGLEFGTERIRPRPHVRPGLDRARPLIDAHIRAAEAKLGVLG